MIIAQPAHTIAEQTLAGVAGWRLVRLRRALSGPLAVVATGGSFAAAVLWARLHEAAGFPAWALTPADFVRRRLPDGAKVLVLSVSGRHHDVLGAARRAPRVYAVVCDRSAPLCDVVRQAGGDALIVPKPQISGMADPALLVPFAVVAAAAYGASRGVAACFEHPTPPPPDERPRHVLALGAGLSWPAAVDFTNRCRESGLATARASDWRDVAHGDLLAIDPSSTWLALFGTPTDADYLAKYAALLPDGLTHQTVLATHDGALGALELLHQAGRLAWDAMARFEVKPALQALPDWLRGLYRLADSAG